jgi:hypothetical protein
MVWITTLPLYTYICTVWTYRCQRGVKGFFGTSLIEKKIVFCTSALRRLQSFLYAQFSFNIVPGTLYSYYSYISELQRKFIGSSCIIEMSFHRAVWERIQTGQTIDDQLVKEIYVLH